MIDKFWKYCCILSLFLILFLGSETQYTSLGTERQVPILTPSLAKQETFLMRLGNGLEVQLISDPEATQAGAVLTVKAGNWDDPAEYPGLAHFLEHMLFLGTEKYPVESEYDSFIRSNNGQTNAYTTTDHTLYLFSVDPGAFEEALDRFSFFFKKPLFNPSGIKRELHAVDQEFEKNLNQDGFRENQVRKELANHKHPFHRFGTGNLKTLAMVKQKDLKKWYEEHYSANLMRLIVSGPFSIDTLKNWVINDFKEIPSTGRAPFDSSQSTLSKEMQGKIVYIETVSNLQALNLTWEIPGSIAYPSSFKPIDVISSILEYDGEGGLLATLKSKGLAFAINCSDQRLSKDHVLFSLHIDLTQKGMDNISQVIEEAFQTFHTLQKQDLPSYIFDDLKKMQTFRYQYQSRENVFDQLMSLGSLFVYEDNIQSFPESALIPHKFDAKVFQAFMARLTPDKTYYTLLAKHPSVSFDKIEEWMQVPYVVKAIPAKLLESWSHLPISSTFQFPPPNPFIPKDLALVNPDNFNHSSKSTFPRPLLLVDDSQAKIYFAQDNRFQIPQVEWSFEIKTPSIQSKDAEKLFLADLYLRCLNEALLPYQDFAQQADFSYKISRTSNGISISLFGYHDQAEKIFDLIAERLKNIRPSEQVFQQLKDSFLNHQSSSSSSDQNPLQLGFNVYQNALLEPTKPESEKNIANLSYQTFLNYLDHLYDYTFTEGLLYGNINQDQASHIWNKLQKTLKSQPYPRKEWMVEKRPVSLPQGPYAIKLQSSSSAHAAVLGIEQKDVSFKAQAAQQILAQAMSSDFYSELRTKQQTGYLVYSRAEEINHHFFTFFAVQSTTHDPRDLLARFELFIESFVEKMGRSKLTEKEFEHIRQSLLSDLENSPKNLEETGQLLKKYAFEYNDLHWMDKRIQGFKELTYAEFMTISKNFLGKENKHRLAILIQGKPDQDFQYVALSNPEELKKLTKY